MTKTREIQDIYHEWEQLHPGHDLDMRVVAQWAIATGKWEPPQYDPLKACARELSRAARAEYYTDPQGREVRRKQSYVYTEDSGQKRWRFADIITGTPEKIQMSLQHRRRSALGDIIQLNLDRRSYNDNNPYGAEIQMSFNFDEDLEELEHPTEYPDAPEEG
ncbi:hypothetical protein [Planctomicrobium piriforme]|uniref:Uncharacterized protein n=1 Tax=Planctomicrobium piriforme TaxID=1576369 RepID=A0A1I3FWH3_9PLAN|nr:hypothetical protein [Planctomicrobium piriforme]SFI15535.1 hypothetical protein SAMN05421753_10662 [Planctomicrobium piriforme]